MTERHNHPARITDIDIDVGDAEAPDSFYDQLAKLLDENPRLALRGLAKARTLQEIGSISVEKAFILGTIFADSAHQQHRLSRLFSEHMEGMLDRDSDMPTDDIVQQHD